MWFQGEVKEHRFRIVKPLNRANLSRRLSQSPSLMKTLFAPVLAAVLLLAAALTTLGQTSGTEAQPSIVSIRGKVVTVQVPAGFDSVTLQALRRPAPAKVMPAGRPAWRTIDTQFPRGESTTLTFRLGKLTPKRSLRIFGTRGAILP